MPNLFTLRKIFQLIASVGLLIFAIANISSSWSDEPQASAQLPRSTAPAITASTHEYRLKNGLKLIVREDHRAPVAIFQIWYKVGSSYEPPGLTGISHMLEHMMFKGTQRLPAGEFSKRVAEYGGVENARTTRDYTMYHQQWEASRIPISFELEADRMQNLTFSPTEFAKERAVVMEERRMRVDDHPQSKTYERFLETAYIASPYQQPVIGWMEDIRHYQLNDVKNWYHTWYAPNNATIVIVGDVNSQAMLALAKKYFGSIPAKKLPSAPRATDVPSLSERNITLRLPAQLPLLLMGFNVPSLSTAVTPSEAYALQMLAGILDGGHSARVETQLIRRQQIAASAGIDYSPFNRGDNLFIFSGVPNQHTDMETLKKAYLTMIDTLKNQPVSADEMARVKAQVISSLIYEKDSVAGQAEDMGELEMDGFSWRLLDSYIANLEAVTPAQIQQVARKYLTTDRLTTATLIPQK